jgi:hypothetical protein
MVSVSGTTWVQIEEVDRDAFELDSRQLEAFRIQDFATAMSGEFEQVFRDLRGMERRFFALANSYAELKARQYIRPPLRVFGGGDAQRSKLRETYELSRFDAKMLEAQHKAQCQNSVILSADPVGGPLRVRLLSWIPGDVIVDGDPLIDDIRDAERVQIRVPIKRTTAGSTTLVTFGRRVYTRTEAYTEAPGGERVGIFNPQGTNPFGFVPLVAVRLTSARSGLFLPALPLDVLSVQISVILAATDVENIARLKTPGREVVTGPQAVLAMKDWNASATSVKLIDSSGSEDINYQYVSTDPRIDRYIQAIDWQLALLEKSRAIIPGGLRDSTGITGAAKQVERQAEVEDTLRQELIWKEAERDLVQLVSAVSKAGPSSLDLSSPSVEVDYRYTEPRENTLQEAQSMILWFAMGADNVARFIAERDSVSIEEGRERRDENLRAWKATLEEWRGPGGEVVAPPGVDSIGSSVLGLTS